MEVSLAQYLRCTGYAVTPDQLSSGIILYFGPPVRRGELHCAGVEKVCDIALWECMGTFVPGWRMFSTIFTFSLSSSTFLIDVFSAPPIAGIAAKPSVRVTISEVSTS
jgi:hypothetical protein